MRARAGQRRVITGGRGGRGSFEWRARCVGRAGGRARSVRDGSAWPGNARPSVRVKAASFLPCPWSRVVLREGRRVHARHPGTKSKKGKSSRRSGEFPAVAAAACVPPDAACLAWPTIRGEAEALGEEEFVTNKGDERRAGSAPLTSPDPPRRPLRRAALPRSSPLPPFRQTGATSLDSPPPAALPPAVLSQRSRARNTARQCVQQCAVCCVDPHRR